MTIRVKLYGEEVTIKDGKAKSDNKVCEDLINLVYETSNTGSNPEKGYIYELSQIFGDNIKYIDSDDEENVVY